MKTTTKLVAIFGLVFCSTLVNAQDIETAKEIVEKEVEPVKEIKKMISVEISEVNYEGKLRPCLKYTVDADAKTLKKHWSKLVKDSYDASVKEIDDKYLVTRDVRVTAISDLRMDLLTTVFGGELNSVINFSSAFGYDIYVDKKVYPKELEALQKIAEDFLYDTSNIYYHEVIADLTKEIAKYNKKNEKLSVGIAKLKAKVTETDMSIEALKQGDTATSTKTTKKISKLTKKKVSYEAEISGDEQQITINKKEIKDLKVKVEYFNKRQEVLNAERKL